MMTINAILRLKINKIWHNNDSTSGSYERARIGGRSIIPDHIKTVLQTRNQESDNKSA